MSTFQEVKIREYMLFERIRRLEDTNRVCKVENKSLKIKVKTQCDELERYRKEIVEQQESLVYATGAGASCNIQ